MHIGIVSLLVAPTCWIEFFLGTSLAASDYLGLGLAEQFLGRRHDEATTSALLLLVVNRLGYLRHRILYCQVHRPGAGPMLHQRFPTVWGRCNTCLCRSRRRSIQIHVNSHGTSTDGYNLERIRGECALERAYAAAPFADSTICICTTGIPDNNNGGYGRFRHIGRKLRPLRLIDLFVLIVVTPSSFLRVGLLEGYVPPMPSICLLLLLNMALVGR